MKNEGAIENAVIYGLQTQAYYDECMMQSYPSSEEAWAIGVQLYFIYQDVGLVPDVGEK